MLSQAAAFGVPMQINHQGVVTVSGVRFSGNGDFRFALVDPDVGSNGTNVWTNDGTNLGAATMPTAAASLPVVGGIYNVRLGDTQLANMTAIPASVSADDNIVLRIWVDDTQGGGVLQLSPDQVLTSAPYAMHARNATNADTLGGVSATQLQTTQPPIGSIIAWHKNVTGVPALPPEWLECNGQTVSDTGSPPNGQAVPNLNGGARFLRGGATSGSLQGDSTRLPSPFRTDGVGDHTHTIPQADQGAPSNGRTQVGGTAIQFSIGTGAGSAHSHAISATGDPETRPINMSVVWIIRIK